MTRIAGLVGFRPAPSVVHRVTAPPYDVIKPKSALAARLEAEPLSLAHVTVGPDPVAAFERLQQDGLVRDDEPAFYVYEQVWTSELGKERRLGVLVACEVTPYEKRRVIRHEKTFDEKVKGRVALANATAHTFGPVFALVRAPLDPFLDEITQTVEPLYDFDTDLGGLNDLHGIHSRVFRVVAGSAQGQALTELLDPPPFYIADGHHRYHAALKNGQTHALMYVTERARIQAYDRVVTGTIPFDTIKATLKLVPASGLSTPPKHRFAIYTKAGSYFLDATTIPQDVVGRLDCSILERELYPHLGLTHAMIQDEKHFDYYPESQLDQARAAVDRGDYELVIALHPVSIDELMKVADAGLDDPNIVMPEKSTFFAPKILSGVFIYRHTLGRTDASSV
jgi:uncharacterized protein (DUF1015 family)